MTVHRLWPNVKEVIRSRDLPMLRVILKDWTPPDLADLMSDLPTSDQVILLRNLPRKLAVSTFQYLLPATQQRLLKAKAQDEVADILNEMSPDARTLLLEELTAKESDQTLD